MLGLAIVALAAGCAPGVAAQASDARSPAVVRASRRAYDGAPPVIPHAPLGPDCTACHDETGVVLPELGFSPPSPHERTQGLSAASRCVQCHVYRETDGEFVASSFVGLRQDLRRGTRQHTWAPPVRPHGRFLRENCAACHTGPAAREEIRTTHPERVRCEQCHAAVEARGTFRR